MSDEIKEYLITAVSWMRDAKVSFLLGMGDRSGLSSSVRKFVMDEIFDANLLPLIFKLISPS